MRKYQPRNDVVLIELELPEKVGDIFLPEESRKQGQRGHLLGVVQEVGPKVREVKKGEKVMFYKHLFTSYDAQKFKKEEGDKTWCLLLREEDIIAVMEKD